MDGKKKKLFICITKSNWGGAQKYVFDIATGVPKDTYDVTVLLGGDGELKKRLEEAGIKVMMLQNSQRNSDYFSNSIRYSKKKSLISYI